MITINNSVFKAIINTIFFLLSGKVNAIVFEEQMVLDQLGDDVCRSDYRPITNIEAEQNRDYLISKMGRWQISGLKDNWVIMGSGYNGEIKQDYPNPTTWCHPEIIEKISVPIVAAGSDWYNEICVGSYSGNELYSPLYNETTSSNGTVYGGAGNILLDKDQHYNIDVMCQPKNEICSITSNKTGIATSGMEPIVITCEPKPASQPQGTKRTHTWAITDTFNSDDFPLLSDLDLSTAFLSDEYLPTATVSLVEAGNSMWLGSGEQPSNMTDFSLLYRTSANIVPFSNGEDTSSNFNNWAFIRKLISFGGEVSSGSHVLAPDSGWINAAHRAGVKVYGTVFIGPNDSYAGLTEDLLGSSYCYDLGIYNNCNYSIPVIDKLIELAGLLKLDGWFLNIESGIELDTALGRERVQHLKRLVEHKLPQINNEKKVEFITYSNLDLGITGLVGDSSIINFGVTPLNDHSVDNATGLTDSSIFYNKEYLRTFVRPYVMYLDETYTRNTIRGEEHPTVRLESAKQTQCQYFNGIIGQTWKGLKEFTLAKYPSGADTTKLLCGGDTSNAVAKRVIRIPLLSGTSVSLSNGQHCSNDSVIPTFWPKYCLLEVGTDETSITISFSGENVSMSTFYQNGVVKGRLMLIPIISAKWWDINKNSSIGRSDDHYFPALTYPMQGLNTYDCIADSVSSTSCIVQLPPANDDWNISAGAYGTPKLLNFIISAEYLSFIWGPRP